MDKHDDIPVRLSDAALDHVRRFLDRQGGEAALRVGVKRTGCSGWGYQVALAEAPAADDAVFEQDGVRVVVAPDALELIRGTEVDFVRQGLNEQFVFRNPNAVAECGCGESFTTDPAHA